MRTSGALLIFLPALTLAFKVDFFKDKECKDTTGSVSVPKGVCLTTFSSEGQEKDLTPNNGQPFLAKVNHDVSDTAESGVAFYGLKDCYRIIGFSNVPSCLGAGNYAAYKAMELDDADKDQQRILEPDPTVQVDYVAPAGKVPLDKAGTPAKPVRKRSTAGDKARNEPHTKRDANLEPRVAKEGLSHGDETTVQGVPHRWHQVGKRAFRGIPVHKWDDKLHKRNAEPHPQFDAENPPNRPSVQRRQHNSPSHPHHPRANSAPPFLMPRALKEGGDCELIRTCLIANPESQFLPIAEIADEFLAALTTYNPPGTDWKFLRQPFAIEFTDPDDPAKTAGFAMAQAVVNADEEEDLALCVDEGGQRAALKEVLMAGVGDTKITDLRADVRIKGQDGRPVTTQSLFVSTRSAGNKNREIAFRPICEAVSVVY